MKVIEKLYKMNLTDVLKDISKAMQKDWEKRCLCEVIWSDILDKNPIEFKRFCKEVYEPYVACADCHPKCLEALMVKDISYRARDLQPL